jgi:hypothetical protein
MWNFIDNGIDQPTFIAYEDVSFLIVDQITPAFGTNDYFQQVFIYGHFLTPPLLREFHNKAKARLFAPTSDRLLVICG